MLAFVQRAAKIDLKQQPEDVLASLAALRQDMAL